MRPGSKGAGSISETNVSSLPLRVRRAIAWSAYLGTVAALGYYGTKLYGHPFRTWPTIMKNLPHALQLAPLSAVLVKVFKVGQAQPVSPAKKLADFLDGRVDHLASQLRSSVEAEQVKRGLRNPPPLDVQWRRMSHGDVAGGPVLIPREIRPAQPFDEVAELYLSFRSRTGTAPDRPRGDRVVIIGAPGAGKTAVTLSLQLGLLDAREQGASDRVPIVLSLSTWSPEREPFPKWAAARLQEIDPELKQVLKNAAGEKLNGAEHMLATDRVLLILDAMDEMPEDFLRTAFQKINELQRWSDRPLIVTCRTEDYERSLVPGAGQELDRALVLQLQPPTRQAVTSYLRSSGHSTHRSTWNQVLNRLGATPDAPIWQVLVSPLMVSLVARIYGSAPVELERKLTRGGLTDAAAIERHLLHELVPTTYAKARAGNVENLQFRWRPEPAEKWLRFLAVWVQSRQGHLNRKYEKGSKRTDTEPDNGQDIAWWRLGEAPQARWFTRIGAGLFGGLIMGGAVALGVWCVFSNRYDRPIVTAFALGIGAVFLAYMGFDCARQTPPPTSNRFGWPRGNWGAPGYAALTILTVATAAGYFTSGAAEGVFWGPIVAAPAAAAYALGTPYVDTAKVSTPRALYRSDIGQTIVYTAGYSVSLGVFAGIYHGVLIGLAMGALAGIAGGFTYGVIYLIVFGRDISGVVAWLRFRLAHLWLASTGRLPWRLFAFLEDAHQLGVLRQAGASYQFLHLRLRDELARPEDPV